MQLIASLKKILNQETILVSAAIFAVSIVNMFTAVILGHALLPDDFGIYTYIISLFTMISVVGFFAQSYVTMNFYDIYSFVFNHRKKIWYLYMGVGGAFLVFIGIFGFNIESAFGYFANIGALLFSFLTAFLIPPGRYKDYFISAIIFAGTRIFITYVATLFSFKVSGALIGLFVAYLLGGMYALYRFRNIPDETKDGKSLIIQWKDFGYAGILVILVTIVSSFDIFLARGVLSPYDFGLYSGTVTVAKLILFVGTPFFTLLLNDISKNKNINYSTLKIIGLFILATIGSFCFINIFKNILIKLLLGNNFTIIHNILLPITLLILGNTLIILNIYITSALKNLRVLVWFLSGLMILVFIMIKKILHNDGIFDLSRMYGILGQLIIGYSIITLLLLCKTRKKL